MLFPPRAVSSPTLEQVLWFSHSLFQWINGKGNEKSPSANLKIMMSILEGVLFSFQMLEKDGLGTIAVGREVLVLHGNTMLKRLLWAAEAV